MRREAPLDAAGFAAQVPVSRETVERLTLYLELLRQWQKAINLVGALGPWWPRARLPAITLVAGAYLLLYTLMDLDTIALTIAALLLSFAPPARVHAVIDRLHGEAPRELPGR